MQPLMPQISAVLSLRSFPAPISPFLQSISGHTWTSSSRPPLKASWPWPLLSCTSTIAFADLCGQVVGDDPLGMILAFCVSSSSITLQGFCSPNACDHGRKPMNKSWNQSMTRLVQLVLNTFSCAAHFQSVSYELNIHWYSFDIICLIYLNMN